MGLISRVSSRTYRLFFLQHGSSQVAQDQKGARKGAKAEPTTPTVVSIQDRQQDPVQRQATTLEANQARPLNQELLLHSDFFSCKIRKVKKKVRPVYFYKILNKFCLEIHK